MASGVDIMRDMVYNINSSWLCVGMATTWLDREIVLFFRWKEESKNGRWRTVKQMEGRSDRSADLSLLLIF